MFTFYFIINQPFAHQINNVNNKNSKHLNYHFFNFYLFIGSIKI